MSIELRMLREKDPKVKELPAKDYSKDGMTKQAFKDQTDINKILAKAQKTGTVSHLAKYEGIYGDFTDIDDLLTAHQRLTRANEIFSELPSEVRREFDQNPAGFFNFVNDPANKDRLKEVLPAIAKAGQYFPVVNEGLGGNPAAEEAAVAAAAAIADAVKAVLPSPAPDAGSADATAGSDSSASGESEGS